MAYRIVAIDDVQLNLDILKEILSDKYDVYTVTSGKAGLSLMFKTAPDLVLLDVSMPEIDGFEVLRRMHENPLTKRIPVIFVTAAQDDFSEENGLRLGAVDYIRKPYNPEIIRIKISNHIELKAYRDNLESLVEERTRQLTASHEAVIMGMSLLSESRDGVTGAHLARIKGQTRLLVSKINELHPRILTEEMAEEITTYSPLHDVGKVGVPDSVLNKSGSLTTKEFALMRSHTTGGGDLLRQMADFLDPENRSQLDTAIEIAENHHEYYDGTGYPHGLAGTDIPLSGRVMALPDVYDALRSTRPYKKGLSHKEAMEIITKGDGRTSPAHFDPLVLDVFCRIHEKMAALFDRNPDPQLIHY